MPPDLPFLDRRDRRTVAMALAAAALLGCGVWVDRFVSSAKAAEARELRTSIDQLSTRLDEFNTRLSWLEGATSGALAPPPVRK